MTKNKDRTVVVDVETSGMSTGNGGRVIEVGAVAIEHGRITEEFESLINSGAAIHFGAFRVHGISETMLQGKPLPEQVWFGFRDFAGDAQLVAHNAPFDSAFIRHELARLGLDLPNRWHCTVRLARQKLPQLHNHKLDTVYRYLFGELPEAVKRHRALDDARMAARIWVELMGKH